MTPDSGLLFWATLYIIDVLYSRPLDWRLCFGGNVNLHTAEVENGRGRAKPLKFRMPRPQDFRGGVSGRLVEVQARLATIRAEVSPLSRRRHDSGDSVHVVVDGVELGAHPTAVVDEPHGPHCVGFVDALETRVPRRHDQSGYDRPQSGPAAHGDARVPILKPVYMG